MSPAVLPEGFGSLAAAHAKLVTLEEQVHADLRVYRWEPRGRVQAPCIWNWLVAPDEESGWENQMVHRDVPIIRATVAVKHSADSDQEVDKLLEYADAFRAVVDPALEREQLDGVAIEARRLGQTTAVYEAGGLNLLAVDFPIRIQLDRRLI